MGDSRRQSLEKSFEMDEVTLNLIRDLSNEVLALKEQMKRMESRLGDARKQNEAEGGQLADAFADVAVIGLREAITWRHKPLKIVWGVLLFLGFAATTYYVHKNTDEYLNKETTTKISLERSPQYNFPPLVLCPPWFFDYDRLLSMNLSPNAFKYSMGYGALLPAYFGTLADYLQNITETGLDNANSTAAVAHEMIRGRTAFYDFYKKNKFKSLSQYFKTVTADFSTDNEELIGPIAKRGNQSDTLFISTCKGCDLSKPIEKKLFSGAMCFVFHLQNVTAKSGDTPVRIVLTNHDRTSGLLESTRKTWLMNYMPNVKSTGPVIQLKAFAIHNIKVNPQRIKMLKDESTCKDTTEKPNLNYDQRECTEICLSNETFLQHGKKEGHISFLATTNINEMGNTFDNLIETFDNDEISTTAIENRTAAKAPSDQEVIDCFAKCLPACDRTIYDVTITHSNIGEHAREDNISVIEWTANHAAVYQGGVVTWQEMESMTWSEYVSNVGGTLGVFLGCTLMTSAQFILSAINYMLTRRTKKNRARDLPHRLEGTQK